MKKKVLKSLLMALACAALLLGAAGCAQKGQEGGEVSGAVTGETAYPVSITDDLGNNVKIEKEPAKIVALAPANTEILFALGVGDKVVGRTDYCNYPEEAAQVAAIGDYNNPNVEKIISLAPDVVLAGDLISDDVRSQIEATGAKVITFTPMSVDAVESTIINTGKVVNAAER